MSETTPSPVPASNMASQNHLSPYDLGTRAEPQVWLPYGTKVTETTPAENFGKVDFDDDAGETICVAWVERDPETGRYKLYVESFVAPEDFSIEHSEWE